MTVSLYVHEEGCSPFTPCRACLLVQFLRKKLSDSGFEEFRTTFLESGFEPGEHKPGCTPRHLCSNCHMVMKLRTRFGRDNATGEDFFETFLSMWEGKGLPEPESVSQKKNLDTKILDLELSNRSTTCLKNEGMATVRDLVVKTEAELLRMDNFGQRSLNEIKEVLASMELTLAGR